MSHDRGCPCGREKPEYSECEDSTCTKQPKKLDCNVVSDGADHHRGEYWYRCTTCGRSDWCARYDHFECNEPLKDCKGKHAVKEYVSETTRGINLNEQKRYVLIRENSDLPPVILNDQEELIRSFNSNLRRDSDRYYELGPEVKVRTTIDVVPSKPVYRGGSTSKRTEI